MAKFLDETGLAKLVSLIKGYAVPLTGGTITGDLTVEGKTTVQTPTEDTDAATKAYVDEAVEGAAYELPIATAETLGGIKVGENLTITEDGVLSATSTVGGGEGDYLPLSGGTMTGAIRLAGVANALQANYSGSSEAIHLSNSGSGNAMYAANSGTGSGCFFFTQSSGVALKCTASGSGGAVSITHNGGNTDTPGAALYVQSIQKGGTALVVSEKSSTSSAKAIEVTSGDTDLGGALNVDGASTFNGTVTVPTPTEDTHAATKAYVDAAAAPKILTAEPTADDLEEGEVAFVVEA